MFIIKRNNLIFSVCIAVIISVFGSFFCFEAQEEEPDIRLEAAYRYTSEGDILTLTVSAESEKAVSSVLIGVNYDKETLRYDGYSRGEAGRDASLYAVGLNAADDSVVCVSLASIDDGTILNGIIVKLEFEVVGEIKDCPFEMFGRSASRSIIGEDGVTVLLADYSVIEILPVSMHIASVPNKLTYIQGEELDTAGFSAIATYDDGGTEVINAEISGYDKDSLGLQTILVNFAGFYDTFEVNVVNGTDIEYIEIVNSGKYLYAPDSATAPEGLAVKAHCYNGAVYSIDSYAVSGFDIDEEGIHTVTVSYEGKTASFDIFVAPSMIRVSSLPTKTAYIENEEFNAEGLSVETVYPDGTTEINTDYAINVDMTHIGKTEVTITSGKGSTSFEIDIAVKTLTGLEVTALPNILDYCVGDSFDRTSLEVDAIYDNGQRSAVNVAITDSILDSVGTKSITAVYRNKVVLFDVFVYAIGDIDRSGAITTADARLSLIMALSDTYGRTLQEKHCADFNCDGTVSTADARQILMIALGG